MGILCAPAQPSTPAWWSCRARVKRGVVAYPFRTINDNLSIIKIHIVKSNTECDTHPADGHTAAQEVITMSFYYQPDDHYVDDFIASRRRSAERCGSRPSFTVILVGRMAAGIRRGAARLEAWARGVDDGLAAGTPVASAR